MTNHPIRDSKFASEHCVECQDSIRSIKRYTICGGRKLQCFNGASRLCRYRHFPDICRRIDNRNILELIQR